MALRGGTSAAPTLTTVPVGGTPAGVTPEGACRHDPDMIVRSTSRGRRGDALPPGGGLSAARRACGNAAQSR
jgi:hypothetical protein